MFSRDKSKNISFKTRMKCRNLAMTFGRLAQELLGTCLKREAKRVCASHNTGFVCEFPPSRMLYQQIFLSRRVKLEKRASTFETNDQTSARPSTETIRECLKSLGVKHARPSRRSLKKTPPPLPSVQTVTDRMPRTACCMLHNFFASLPRCATSNLDACSTAKETAAGVGL